MHYLHFHEQLGQSRTISRVYSWSHNYFILLSSYSIFTLSFVSLKIIIIIIFNDISHACNKVTQLLCYLITCMTDIFVTKPRCLCWEEGLKNCLVEILVEFHMLPTDTCTNIILLFCTVSILTERYTWLEKEVLFRQH